MFSFSRSHFGSSHCLSAHFPCSRQPLQRDGPLRLRRRFRRHQSSPTRSRHAIRSFPKTPCYNALHPPSLGTYTPFWYGSWLRVSQGSLRQGLPTPRQVSPTCCTGPYPATPVKPPGFSPLLAGPLARPPRIPLRASWFQRSFPLARSRPRQASGHPQPPPLGQRPSPQRRLREA